MHRVLLLAIWVCFCAMLFAAKGAGAVVKAGPQVGIYYFPGWYRAAGDPSGESSEWRNAIMKAATPRPLCGFYNDADPRLWDYYTPWMTSHGIDFIAFDWYYNAGQEYLNDSLDRGFLQSAKNINVKFCCHWCNHGGPWWKKQLDQTKPAMLEMTDLLCARYFQRPNYLRIDGRPVFMIYEMDMLLGYGGGLEAVQESLAAIRKRAKEKGFPDLYLVAVYPGASPEYMKLLKKLGFDALCAYTYAWMRPPSVTWDTQVIPYPDLADHLAEYFYPDIERKSKEVGIPYWPTTFSGWDDRPRAGLEKALVDTSNTPEAFGRMFRGALKHVSPASPVVLVEAWNEWGEGACIEPSKEHGFGFLRTIASAVGKSSSYERLPSAEEIASWSVLTTDELKIAKENETKPWPVKEPKRYKFGKSFDAPDAKMPYVFDLTSSGISQDDLALSQLTIRDRSAEGTSFESTGGDPGIILPEVRIPAGQIKRITVEGTMAADVLEGHVRPQVEFYWTTGLMPEFAGFASAATVWSTADRTIIKTADIPAWKKTGTPFLRLRIDPCSSPGVKFRIRRVILSGD
jgi:hypothetical protein